MKKIKRTMILTLFFLILVGQLTSVYSAEVEDKVLAVNSEKYQSMIERSLLSEGNNMRLKDAIEKAKRGEDVTIAFIGGSITQGAGASPLSTENYAYKTYVKFKEMFGKDSGDNVHFIKAGVGGTSSELGVIRYERDVLRDGKVKPDIVVIEFAVNDLDDETKGVSYESLVLKSLSGENNPAVILLFSVFKSDWNLQDRLAPVGYHYDLPMVSIKDAVVNQFGSEGKQVISKEDFFYDQYHPTNAGHTIMADSLAHLFAVTAEAEKAKEDINLDKKPVIGDYFKDIRLLDKKTNTDAASIEPGGFKMTDHDLQRVEMDDDSMGTRQFPNNWMHKMISGMDSFKMTIKSSSLVLVYKDSGSSQFGKAEVYVDGEFLKALDPHKNNWTHTNATILYREAVSKEHKIEIKMAEGDEFKSFTILGFGYTQ